MNGRKITKGFNIAPPTLLEKGLGDYSDHSDFMDYPMPMPRKRHENNNKVGRNTDKKSRKKLGSDGDYTDYYPFMHLYGKYRRVG